MDRHLSLSQAARLIGVKRGDIQKKIQANELTVMEGTVVLSDLKKAFPDAIYEDNSMLEKVEKFMQDAVHKMAQSEREGARLDALSRRIVKVNQELAAERQRSRQLEELIDSLRQELITLNNKGIDEPLHNTQQWLDEQLYILNHNQSQTPVAQLEKQIQQFMLPHVRLLPSRHDFISDKSETLLESALRSGLAVDYGCNNGKCGKCKARLVSGQVEKMGHQDYVFPENEKQQGYILTCSNTAITDITLETEEAINTEDIPLQSVTTKVKRIDKQHAHVAILTLKTSRSQRLRFLSGQTIELSLNNHQHDNGQPINAEYSIASCPCEPSNLEFHIPIKDDEPFAHAILHKLKENESITLNGPHGHFILNEDSPNSLIFIAWDTGFASIKSLMEHAMSLDKAESIHLYWFTTKIDYHYKDNLCRAWNDALDNFTYTRIMSEAKISTITDRFIQHLHYDHPHLLNFDFYISAPGHLNHQLKPALLAEGVNSQNMHFEQIFHGQEVTLE